jgi:uncharacterized membrane protein
MFILPSGLVLPPLAHLFALVAATLLVGIGLFAIRPPVNQPLSLAMMPWIALGGMFHAFQQLGYFPGIVDPLFTAPSVYLTTFVITGFIWGLLGVIGTIRGRPGKVTRNLGLVGTAVFAALISIVLASGLPAGVIEIVWPTVIVIGSLVLTALVVLIVSLWRTPLFLRVRYVAPVVLGAHVLDGVSTAVGADVIGMTERTPIPAAIMDLAAQLPTADVIGVGWLFVLVKVVIPLAIVLGFHRYVADEPVESTLLLTFVAAVGLGPAANNIILFLISP